MQIENKILFLLTDIDDTLTTEGKLPPNSYKALWDLYESGVKVIPITGRPAGWCEMIARFWPVEGIVGENGGFYFRFHNQKMIRHFSVDSKLQKENQKKLKIIEKEILKKVPNARVSTDQFCRWLDLAIDFAEDVEHLSQKEIGSILKIFRKHRAQAKVSSIHVNGWFGTYNKLSQTLFFLKKEFQITKNQAKEVCAFIGDSPNDEPMWKFFPKSIAVANVHQFLPLLKHKPKWIAQNEGGDGFAEVAQKIISNSLIF